MSDETADSGSNGLGAVADEAESVDAVVTRTKPTKLKRWVLLTGPRMALVGLLVVAVFALLVGLTFVRPVDMRRLLSETNTVITLFSSLLSGAILLVSIVVSINSTVLSQELGDVQSQQESVTSSIEFHQRIEEFIEPEITPAEPAEFLQVVLHTIARQTVALEDLEMESGGEIEERLDTFRNQVVTEVLQARETLNTRSGPVTVLLVGLNYDYASQLHATRQLKKSFEGDDEYEGDEESQTELDALLETLKVFATGREYFKSLYYKRELAHFSSRLLYVALPVIVFTSYILLAVNTELLSEASLLGVSPLLVFVSLAYAVALAPYLVLTAYVLRLVAVTLRTLSSGPFILRDSDEPDELDWDSPEESLDWEQFRDAVDE